MAMASSTRDDTNEVYRECTLGLCLENALAKLSTPLDPNLIEKVRSQFDKEMKDLIPPNGPIMKMHAARIESYKFVEHTWNLNLEDINIRRQRPVASADKIVLIARQDRNFHSKAKRQKKKDDPDSL